MARTMLSTPIALVIPIAVMISTVSPAPLRRVCTTVADCNNGGKCVDGRCRCDAVWEGPTCDALRFEPGPGPEDIGLQNRVNTWGGSVVKAVEGGHTVYHMYASAFPNATLDDWVTKSQVAHAVSRTGVMGPYEYQGIVLPPRGGHYWDASNCHNPTVHKFDDDYVIFYIGMDYKDHRHEPSPFDPWQAIGAASSKSPYGPWTRLDMPLLVPTVDWECYPDCGVSNPAVARVADGSFVMIFRGNGDQGVGIAAAPHWYGPWTLQNGKKSIFPLPDVVGLEDAYLWNDPTRDGCHIVLHQQAQGATNIGAHAFTTDPACVSNWTLSSPRPSHAYSTNVTWSSGKTTTYIRRERPQLLFDEAGHPTHMFSAVQAVNNTKQPTRSHTIVVPLSTPQTP
eukprot:TRINITY_DN6025_c0_g2_i1.p1 TRINITY_DN6025_c0_g2~~TRINITY_DN6025_c0_g2_i1.p1  ORF type:complete len:420 (+),score=50.47 TRINITY_DN6025_c0_g2_i1:76-1260(+)